MNDCHMVVYLKEYQQSEVNLKNSFWLSVLETSGSFDLLFEGRGKKGCLKTSMDAMNECLHTFRKWSESHDYMQELVTSSHR